RAGGCAGEKPAFIGMRHWLEQERAGDAGYGADLQGSIRSWNCGPRPGDSRTGCGSGKDHISLGTWPAPGTGISNAEYPDLTADSPSVLSASLAVVRHSWPPLMRRDVPDAGGYRAHQRDCRHVRFLMI